MEQLCGCKGARFCGFCKDSVRVRQLREPPEHFIQKFNDHKCYVYANGSAYHCDDLYAGSSVDEIREKYRGFLEKLEDRVDVESLEFNGISLIEDFLNEDEEKDIVSRIETKKWMLSQSGRRKQDFGPKVNFKQKKVKCGDFRGVPDYADLVLKRLESFDVGKFGNYKPFELCNLEYDAKRQSTIEFHQDDSWIWGERLISLNFLEDSIMTFERAYQDVLIFVYMPRRSILCFSGDARFRWRHGIFSWHIQNRRISLTMREPGKDFQEGGELYEEYGKELIERGNRRIQTFPSNPQTLI